MRTLNGSEATAMILENDELEERSLLCFKSRLGRLIRISPSSASSRLPQSPFPVGIDPLRRDCLSASRLSLIVNFKGHVVQLHRGRRSLTLSPVFELKMDCASMFGEKRPNMRSPSSYYPWIARFCRIRGILECEESGVYLSNFPGKPG